MAKQTATRSGKYLYAIIAGSEDMSCGPIGIDGGEVYSISNGRISAVVSDVPNEKIRPERRNIAAYQEVLKRLIKENTALPMCFGIIANGHKEVKNILTRNQETLLVQIRLVAGKVEMGLRVTWDVPNIFEYFVKTHSELKSARDRIFGSNREPTLEEKIEVGRMFERIHNKDRELYTEKVGGILVWHCFDIKKNKCRNEREVMNLACLIWREAQDDYEAAVFEAARLFDNNFAFDYNGPWAPHNFVDIDLKL